MKEEDQQALAEKEIQSLQRKVHQKEMAAALAEQVISALQPHLKEPDTEMFFVCKPLHAELQRLLPDKIKFDRHFDKGIEAFYDKRWDAAEKELEKAVNTPYGYIPSNIRSLSEITNNIHVARFFLGLTRTQNADWTGALALSNSFTTLPTSSGSG